MFLLSLLLTVGCFGASDTPPTPSGPQGPFAVFFSLDGPMPQFSNPAELLGKPAMSQHRFDKIIKKAALDFKVQEVVVHIGSPQVSLARASEIVEILRQVTKAGKSLVCHMDSADNIGYWIASSACPKLLLSPAGEVSALGLALEPVFIRELLATLGISAEMLHVGAYKDAADALTRDSMSDESRTAATEMLAELHNVLVAGISTSRKLDAAKVRSIIDNGPYSASEAKKLGLVDEILPLQSYLETLIATYQGGVVDDYGKPPVKQLSITDLMKLFGDASKDEKAPTAPRIALVPIMGPIVGGQNEDNLMGGQESVHDISLTATLGELARDATVKAVVLRIDSPGGSALASDNIWHAVRHLASKKPVVASMGDVAASGGYYIASAAQEVFATPATLTGSIGVVGGKMVFREAAEKIGVRTERLQTGKRAGLFSPFTVFDEEERKLVTKMMQEAYHLFVDRVATGRNLPREKVLAVAEGRVWTGSQALSHGLINHIGGLTAAIARVRVLASLPAGVEVDIMPKPKSLMELMGEAFSEPEARVAHALAKQHPAVGLGLTLTTLLRKEQVLAIAPYTISAR